MTHRDEIDKFLFDLVGVLPGCCSSIESVKYTIARTVAEALWPKKDLALSLAQVVKLDSIIMNMVGEGYNDGYKTRPFYEEVLKRFNEQRKK